MISRIRGILRSLDGEQCEIDVGGVCYQVLLAPTAAERLAEEGVGSEVELYTYYYLQGDAQKSIPVLLGFESETQREFFKLLLQVPRMGPRAALKAMALPVSTLAQAIEVHDLDLLRSLPGVGAQRAKDIVSTLAGKVASFAAGVELPAGAPELESDAAADAAAVLEQLGVPRAEAVRLVALVKREHPEVDSAEEIIRLAFKMR